MIAATITRPDPGRSLALLAIATVAMLVLGAGVGATWLHPGTIAAALVRPLGLELPWGATDRDVAILWAVRLPRVALAALVGAGLGMAGAALQAIVRNPLADPGLLGVSNGAACAAAGVVVFGAPLASAGWGLPAVAFAGALVAMRAVLAIARVDGRVVAGTLVLGGVAIAAFTAAATGLIVFVADDAQLRSIAFWNLGSVGGATWRVVATAAVPLGLALARLPRHASALDRLLLGEREARHVGVEVERVTRRVVWLVALATGAAVATCGVIGFVGLAVPHVLRGWLGPAHAALLPACALGGAILLIGADLIARTIAAPAELPVGIVTALIGAPFLLAIVRRDGRGLA